MSSRRKSTLGQRTKNARILKLKRKNETPNEKNLRLAKARTRSAAKIQAETPEMRLARLKEIRERMAKKRQSKIYKERAACRERSMQLLAARMQLADEQAKNKEYQELKFDRDFFNQSVKELLIYHKTVRNTEIAESTNLSSSCNNETLMSDAQASKSDEPIEEESLS